MKKYRKILIPILILIILLIIYHFDRSVIKINTSDIVVESNYLVKDLNVYSLPRGSFRGVNWNFRDNQAFEIWTVNNLTVSDTYDYITVPDYFDSFDKEEKNNRWDSAVNIITYDKQETHIYRHKDNNITFTITLPFKKGKGFSVSILENSQGAQLVMFMNLTNKRIHRYNRGLFGFFVLESDCLRNKVDD